MANPDFPRWQSDEDDIDTPPSSKQDAGSKSGHPASAQFFNWLFLNIWKWIRGLQGHYADIVVGSSAEVTALQATHTIDTFAAAVVDNDQIAVLDGTHTASGAVALTEKSLKFVSRTAGAVINMAGFAFTSTGGGVRGELNFTDTPVADVAVSGADSALLTNGLNGASVRGRVPTVLPVTAPDTAYFDSPLQVGSDLNFSGGTPTLTAMDPRDIAFIDSANLELRRYRWNFSTSVYALQGTEFALPGAGVHGVTRLTDTDVAFIGGGDSDLTTMRFTEGTGLWAQVGSALNDSFSGSPALVSLNETDIVTDTSGALQLYRWNGSTWATLGAPLTVTSIGQAAFTRLNNTDIGFIDGTNDDLRVYRFDYVAETWAQVGSDTNIATGGGWAISALNSTDIALIDGANDDLRLYRFDGDTFAEIVVELPVASVVAPAMSAVSEDTIAFYDSSQDDLRRYQFARSGRQTPILV